MGFPLRHCDAFIHAFAMAFFCYGFSVFLQFFPARLCNVFLLGLGFLLGFSDSFLLQTFFAIVSCLAFARDFSDLPTVLSRWFPAKKIDGCLLGFCDDGT